MNPETIRDHGYIVELNYPPMNYVSQNLRDLVNDVLARYNFTSVNYSANQDEVVLSSREAREREITRAGFFRNRMFLEKGPIHGGTIESFLPVVEDMINLTVNRLRIPLFIQRNVIRIIANPDGLNDSRIFIGSRVCSFTEDVIRVFGRPIHAVGLRWFFPPTNPNQPEYDVKIETLLRDASLIFIENSGRFQQPVNANQIQTVINHIRETRNFITTEIVNFLVQFNQR